MLGIAIWVLPRTWTLLREAGKILLEGVPAGVDLDTVERAMLDTRGVLGVHDLHVWELSSGKVALSAHVRVDETLAREESLEDALGTMLATRFGITHSTVAGGAARRPRRARFVHSPGPGEWPAGAWARPRLRQGQRRAPRAGGLALPARPQSGFRR